MKYRLLKKIKDLIFEPDNAKPILEYLAVICEGNFDNDAPSFGWGHVSLAVKDMVKISKLAKKLSIFNPKETIVLCDTALRCQVSAEMFCSEFGCKYILCTEIDCPTDQSERSEQLSKVTKMLWKYAKKYKNIIILSDKYFSRYYPDFFTENTLKLYRIAPNSGVNVGEAFVIACKDIPDFRKPTYYYDYWPTNKGHYVKIENQSF